MANRKTKKVISNFCFLRNQSKSRSMRNPKPFMCRRATGERTAANPFRKTCRASRSFTT